MGRNDKGETVTLSNMSFNIKYRHLVKVCFDKDCLAALMKNDKNIKAFDILEEFEYDGGTALVMYMVMKMPMCKERDMVSLMYCKEMAEGKSLGFSRSINQDKKPVTSKAIRMQMEEQFDIKKINEEESEMVDQALMNMGGWMPTNIINWMMSKFMGKYLDE